jgi:hypothetical protein
VDYDDHTNVGRHVLFHRARACHDERVEVASVIDPAYWISPPDYVRMSLPDIHWYLEVYPMGEHGWIWRDDGRQSARQKSNYFNDL